MKMNHIFMLSLEITAALLAMFVAAMQPASAQKPAMSQEYADFNPGVSVAGSSWVKSIRIASPQEGATVNGDVDILFSAPGMTTAKALCWHQPTVMRPDASGYDALIGSEIKLDADGGGKFVFPADQFPNGPITVRILANNADFSQRDIEELQLYNEGGVKWNQGIPKSDPPGAAGMKLLFADDFDGPLSISHSGKNTRYCSHKPGGGDFSGWPFSDFEGPYNPFSQVGTYLRIHASKNPDGKASSGLISPVALDGSGVYASVPFYMECRFIAQSAPGTWPAFWTLTKKGPASGVDELDIIEGYGGVGKGNPNHPGYSVTSHFWGQSNPDGTKKKAFGKRIDMLTLPGGSYWSTTFHTYGLKVTDTDTIYYFDNREVFRHPTGDVSKSEPAFFMINYAIGGISGWKIDMEREGDVSDMYVDYVRVYQGAASGPQ